MRFVKNYILLIGIICLYVSAYSQSHGELDVATIMQDPKVWLGSSPKKPYWSEDNQWIYFLWNPESADSDSIYNINISGGNPVKLSIEERQHTPARLGKYSRNYQLKLYEKNGDIYLFDRKVNQVLRITNTSAIESNSRFSQDETAILFQRGMNLFKWNRETGTIRQITDFRLGEDPENKNGKKSDAELYVKKEAIALSKILKNRKELAERTKKAQKTEDSAKAGTIYLGEKSIKNLILSPDELYVTFLISEEDTLKATIVPDYVTESGFTEDLETRHKVGFPQNPPELAILNLKQDTLIYINTENIKDINKFTKYSFIEDSDLKDKKRKVWPHGPFWSDDGQNAFVELKSIDNKDRWLALLDLASGELDVFEHQHDDAWVSGPNIGWSIRAGSVGWMPDNKGIWYCSEESGFSHLYMWDSVTKNKKSLTSGKFQILKPHISRDKKFWYFTSNEIHPGERHFYRMPVSGGKRERLTSMTGRNDVVVSPDGKKLAILHSYMNQPPELYIKETKFEATEIQLTVSTTEKWREYSWQEPEIIQFTTGDEAKPFARLYRSKSPNGAGVIFVHGAGHLQNAHKWWSSYFREYMFHNLLADRGYTVLDIDYRGSAGYGRDWRTAIYRYMGDKDLEDHVDGAKWLVKELKIDPKRIGIYGGSYGGFITLMAMFTRPGVFAAGAALRPVTDWAHYNHRYTSNILNIPQADTLAYRRSSPIYFAEGLRGHLLICHGMVDINVHFQDTVRLVQRLIELGKENWEVAIYPVEGHSFKETSSWTDEYSRILKLFDQTLTDKNLSE